MIAAREPPPSLSGVEAGLDRARIRFDPAHAGGHKGRPYTRMAMTLRGDKRDAGGRKSRPYTRMAMTLRGDKRDAGGHKGRPYTRTTAPSPQPSPRRGEEADGSTFRVPHVGAGLVPARGDFTRRRLSRGRPQGPPLVCWAAGFVLRGGKAGRP